MKPFSGRVFERVPLRGRVKIQGMSVCNRLARKDGYLKGNPAPTTFAQSLRSDFWVAGSLNSDSVAEVILDILVFVPERY